MMMDMSRDLVWLEFAQVESDQRLNELIAQLREHTESILYVGNQRDTVESITCDRLVGALGRSIEYGILNAFDGFSPNALAQLAGMIRAPGKLFIVSPLRENWPTFADPNLDALGQKDRYNSRYISFLIKSLSKLSDVKCNLKSLSYKDDVPSFSKATFTLTHDQTICLSSFDRQWGLERSITVLTADRGRGKSTVLGHALAHSSFKMSGVIVCAPDKHSVESLYEAYNDIADNNALPAFYRPAEALSCLIDRSDVELLVIDEAAAIPTPLLTELVKTVPHLAITTTISGYEGFGRGFSLRFIDQLVQLKEATHDKVQFLTMQMPVRWQEDDRLERVINTALLINEPAPLSSLPFTEGVHRLSIDQLLACHDLVVQIYHLLHLAHYRTSPNDFRVLLDSPGQHLFIYIRHSRLMGVLWISAEGHLAAPLCESIWAGERRPKGHLLPQSLMFHEGWVNVGTSIFWRIARIAVVDSSRREGIGSALLAFATQEARAEGVEFIGASFASYDSVWQFWQAQHFNAIRVGEALDPVAGQPSLLVLKGLSTTSSAICDQMRGRAGSRYLWEYQHKLRGAMPLGFEDTHSFINANEPGLSSIDGFVNRNVPWFLVRPWVYQIAQAHQQSELITACLTVKLPKQALATVKQCLRTLINKG